MWTNRDRSYQPREFSTPPRLANSRNWRSPSVPQSAPAKRADPFHVIHKVPAGDSPYVKAKRVQLIDKDPSKAISLFWAAINSGDRVDSALKDMAVVMKQLDRSDEAVEAIKSFRHLCPHDSQEPLDNILLELYKRSGRIDDQIKMLEAKVKSIEEGFDFSGKRVKAARSQGKKIYMTVEQEYSRLSGNLAWAYMQNNDYKSAEAHYRKALSLEPDKNKQCNLAICLMNMKRITEAKMLLHTIKSPNYRNGSSSVENETYVRSLERATEMLAQLECPGGAARGLLTPALQTQPRRCSVGLVNGGDQRRSVIGDDGKCARKLAFGENVEKENGNHLLKTENKRTWADANGMKNGEKENGSYFLKTENKKSWADENGKNNGENAEKENENYITAPKSWADGNGMKNEENGNYFLKTENKKSWADANGTENGENAEKENQNYTMAPKSCADGKGTRNRENAEKENENRCMLPKSNENGKSEEKENENYFMTPNSKKSWADMVEEEEKESPFAFQTQPRQGFKVENYDSNVMIAAPLNETNLVSSLVNFVEDERLDEYLDSGNGIKMLKRSSKRLQVFKDITSSSER